MALRSAHGRGQSALVRIETLPADELPSATPPQTDRSERGPDGRFLPSNTVARNRRLRPATGGLDKADPAYRKFLRWGRRYATHRRTELAKAHGGEISAGVGALVESAGLALAASRFLYDKGSETADPELLKRAAALSADARTAELSAWELAAREAATRPKRNEVEALKARLMAKE